MINKYEYDKDKWYHADTDKAKENLSENDEKFEQAINLAISSMCASACSFKDGNEKRGIEMKDQARLILDTISILTGRDIDLEFSNCELTAFSLVENKHSDNKKTIYSLELSENGVSEKYYILDAPLFGTKELNDLGCEYDEDKDQWFNADFKKALDATASLRERAQSREAEISVTNGINHGI